MTEKRNFTHFLTDGLILFIISVVRTASRRFMDVIYKNCMVQKLLNYAIAIVLYVYFHRHRNRERHETPSKNSISADFFNISIEDGIFIVDSLISWTSSELRNRYGRGNQQSPMLQKMHRLTAYATKDAAETNDFWRRHSKEGIGQNLDLIRKYSCFAI